jgi:hypothetical protein
MAPDDGHAAFLLPGLDHNRGPPFDEGADGRLFCWRKAYRTAWKTPPREIALARLARAAALDMPYREYTAILLDRGLHL